MTYCTDSLSLSNLCRHDRHSPEVKLLQADISQIVVGPLVDVSLRFYFVVVRQTVDFMYEHLKVDVRVDFVGSGHSEV